MPLYFCCVAAAAARLSQSAAASARAPPDNKTSPANPATSQPCRHPASDRISAAPPLRPPPAGKGKKPPSSGQIPDAPPDKAQTGRLRLPAPTTARLAEIPGLSPWAAWLVHPTSSG